MSWTWLLTIASIIGVVANIKKRRWCFGVWTGTNFSWMVVDFYFGIYSQAALFAVYFGLAIWGLLEWKKQPKKEDK